MEHGATFTGCIRFDARRLRAAVAGMSLLQLPEGGTIGSRGVRVAVQPAGGILNCARHVADRLSGAPIPKGCPIFGPFVTYERMNCFEPCRKENERY